MTHVFFGGNTGSSTGNKSHRLLDEDKNVIWSADHGGAVRAVAVRGDYVYIAGARSSSLTTRKYNSSGTLQWSVDHGATVYAIAVDSAGNVYTGGDPVSNVKIRKYNSSGTVDTGWNLQWATGGGYPEQVYALCVDASYLYATKYRGFSNTQTVRKYLLSDASVVWSKDIELVMAGVAVDNSGNVYVCGERNFGNYHLFKLNSAGTTQWSKDPGGAGALGTAVAVDLDGNVYAAANNGLYQYNSSGTQQWAYDHGWNVYGVAVGAASQTTAIPALLLSLALAVPTHTLFDAVPALALPLRLAVPTTQGGVTPDFTDLAATVAALAAEDPATWAPYTALSSAALNTLATPVYTGTVAGLDSSMQRFSVIGLQCNRRTDASSWVVASIAYDAALFAALFALIDGELLIDAGFRLPNGPASYGPFLRMAVTEVLNETSPWNGRIDLKGRVIDPPFVTTTRTLTGTRRIQTDTDRRTVTCTVDPLLRPNDTAIAGAETFTVGAIDYRIDPWMAVMTVTEQ
jgi:hypothetical protein